MSEKIRKEFEAYALTMKVSRWNKPEDTIRRNKEGRYIDTKAYYAWLGHQAAYKASRHEELVALTSDIVSEAIEHWPDAENWECIKQAQELLKSMEK